DMSEFRRALSCLDGTDNELQNIVAKSIARCRRYSKDFVGKFYQKVQYGGHFPADYVQFSDIENQHKMFNGVLNLLMEYEHDHQFFHKLSGMKAHTQLAPKHYEIFLDLLLETVSEYDSQWNKIPAVPAAWNTLRDRVLERLKR
ncbi:MAG: hypothetical protein IT260_24595, partial [Saprospiraceae bacterium]|nr:hypothetical protein [Saprospiraceae bacterium]